MRHALCRGSGGFAFKDLLILVLSVAVVFAIAVPLLSPTAENILEMVDRCCIYNAYSEVIEASLVGTDSTDERDASDTMVVCRGNQLVRQVTMRQLQTGWQSGVPEIGGMELADFSGEEYSGVRITMDLTTRAVTFTYTQ